MNEQSQVIFGAVVGAIVGTAAGYLFFTERGRVLRDRIEPAIDDARHELTRFHKAIERAGELATDGLRMVNEFNQSRAQAYPTNPMSQ